jgi:uncharacterized protein (DUF2132 family)
MSDKTPKPQTNNPLHGLTLATIVTQLHEHYGWETLASRIDIRCFKSDPSVKSSLKFLRKTPWARTKVETLYLRTKFKKQPSAIAKPSKPQQPTEQRPSKQKSLGTIPKPSDTISSKPTVSSKPADSLKPNTAEQAQATKTKPPEPTPQATQSTDPSEAVQATESPETAKATTSNKERRRFAGGNSASKNNKRSF